MVELGSRLWKEYEHAYGSAADVPELLRAARDVVRSRHSTDDPWHGLWSALCHQFDVYSASVAALPHLVNMAAERPASERGEPLRLAGAIETYRHRANGPSVPSYLETSYRLALAKGAELAGQALAEQRDGAEYAALLAALAAFQGHPQLAAAIDALEQRSACPSCGAAFSTAGFDLFG